MTRRTPEQYDWDKVEFDETILGKHITSPRREKIQFVVIHHMAMVGHGDGSANDACVRAWQTRQASAQYCVDGRFVRQVVWDSDAAWATANSHGNHAGISIEHANSTGKPTWKVSDETVATGAKLVAYLHKVYNLGRPVLGKTLFQHKDFFSTTCAGPYLGGSHLDEYVAEAQRVYDEITEGAPVPAPKLPADVIDLASYKLTKDDGSEVKQPALDTYTYARFHVTASGDGVAFRARCGGGTTPHSTHTRCELREMANNGLNVAVWDNHHGTHEQSAAYRVEHLPKNKPEAVAMQIHDKYDDVVMVRLVGDPAHPLAPIKVYAEWSKGQGLGSVKELLGSVHLDQKFYVRIVADPSGIRVRFQVSGSSVVTERKRATVKAGLYFKAGCYNQSDTDHDAASDYAEIVIYKNSLKVRHA